MLIYSARPALGFGKNMWLGINLLKHLSQWKSNILSFLNRCYDEYGRSKIQRDRLVDLHAWQNIPFFISLLNSISQARNETDFQRFFHCENNCILMERRCLHINRFRLTNRLAWNRNRAYMLPIRVWNAPRKSFELNWTNIEIYFIEILKLLFWLFLERKTIAVHRTVRA